jgi:ADP-ribose pyrophosphatase
MNIKPWTVLSSEIIYETPWIQVIEDKCQVDDQVITYTRVNRRDEGPQIIAETADKKLFMVQQYRHPIHKIVWQFPAEGKTDQESWEDAAQRGLREEIGMSAEKLTDLGVFHPDPGLLDQTSHAFLAQGLTPNPTTEKVHLSNQEVEDLRVDSFTLSEIDELIEKGEICDGWTLSGLFLYQRYLKKNS